MDAHASQFTVTDYRLRLERTGHTFAADAALAGPAQAAQVIQGAVDSADREYFVAVALNARNRPVAVHTVSVGSLTAAIVHPRELFKFAVLANASALVIGHNHPSGDPTPSRDDIDLTARLVAAGRLMGIEVLDSIIIGEDGYLSMREHGLL